MLINVILNKIASTFGLLSLSILSFIFYSCEKDITLIASDETVYYGFIFIDSNPSGAAIFKDGKNTGRFTPDSLRYLPSGNYSVTLKLKYFRDTSFSVQLSDPDLKEYLIDYYSNPLMLGSINFTSDPLGAKIFINDSSIQAVTPFFQKNVKPGSYVVRYQKDNHRDATINVLVESNKTASSYFKMRDTLVWVDYQLYNSSIASNFLTCLDVDLNNIKWIGSFDKGLMSYDGENFKNFSTVNSPIPSNNILCVSVDQNNNKWFGTDAGIAVFNNSSWVVYTKSNSGLANNSVNSIKFENNIAWIGTPAGLIKYDGVNWVLFDTIIVNPQPEFAAVNDITLDTEGSKWLGTANTGIFKFKDGIFGKPYRDSIPGISSNRISTTAISQNGEKWFGHLPGPGKRGGVSIFNGNSWKSIFIGTDGNLIEDIYVDQLNNKWISTNEGLFQIVGETPLFFYNRNNSLISFSHVKAVVRDNDGLIWVATYGGGLNKLKQ